MSMTLSISAISVEHDQL